MMSNRNLEWFHERPQKCSNSFTAAEQFDQSHDTEETEKIDWNDICASATQFAVDNIDEWSKDDDKVEWIPSIAKIVFWIQCNDFEECFEGKDTGEYQI